jgi:hypothetical protein
MKRRAYIRRRPYISWPLDDGAFRLDIIAKLDIGAICFIARVEAIDGNGIWL